MEPTASQTTSHLLQHFPSPPMQYTRVQWTSDNERHLTAAFYPDSGNVRGDNSAISHTALPLNSGVATRSENEQPCIIVRNGHSDRKWLTVSRDTRKNGTCPSVLSSFLRENTRGYRRSNLVLSLNRWRARIIITKNSPGVDGWILAMKSGTVAPRRAALASQDSPR